MSGMKYQVGDRVKIKSFDWFRNGACIGFSTLMSKYCGEVLTIRSKNNINDYRMKEDGGLFCWTDDMIECVMNISKLGTAANPVEPKLNAKCSTWEKVDGLATKIDKELPSGNQNVWELPDGYQFVDENGNVINATIIALEKKKTEYPKTYEECCEVLSIPSYYNLRYYTIEHGRHEFATLKELDLLQNNLNTLSRLLICCKAYWKLAGEEMGLNKPWEPDYDSGVNKYGIICMNGVVQKSNPTTNWERHLNKVLDFPTEEMRDAFYEAFNEFIEECKELL